MFSSQKEEEKQNVRQKLEKKREERSSGSSSPTGSAEILFKEFHIGNPHLTLGGLKVFRKI